MTEFFYNINSESRFLLLAKPCEEGGELRYGIERTRTV